MESFAAALEEVRGCTLCSAHLPLGPRPVIQFHQDARILIAGQAPGRKVHESGIPFADVSGDRLRDWLGVSPAKFYDPTKIAILPMGFCYPGTGTSGDLPPRPECAPKWREQLLSRLTKIHLTVVIGHYALAYHCPEAPLAVTEAVKDWKAHWPNLLVLPHPSPRNNIWLAKNRWFSVEVLPILRTRIREILGEPVF